MSSRLTSLTTMMRLDRRIIEGRVIARALHRIGQMHRAGAHFGIGPVVGHVGRPVLERRRGDDDAVGLLQHRQRQGLGRIDPVAMQADIGFAAADLVDREPFDEQRVRLLEEPRQHVDPAADHQFAAPPERARHRLDAAAVMGGELGRFVIELLGKRRGQRRHRPLEIDESWRQARPPPRQGRRPAARNRSRANGRNSARRAPAPAGAPATGNASAAPSGVPAWMRRVQPGPGRAWAALQHLSAAAFPPLHRRRRDRRCGRRGRARAGRSISGPRSQRRSSAVSSAVRWPEKALSAASKR